MATCGLCGFDDARVTDSRSKVAETAVVLAGLGRLVAVRLVRCPSCRKTDRQEIRSVGEARKGYVETRVRPEPCQRTRSAIREHAHGRGTP